MSVNKKVSIKLGSGTNLLTILFVILKVTDKIDWSWWWVLAPSWVPLVIFFGILGVFFMIALLAAMVDKRGL